MIPDEITVTAYRQVMPCDKTRGTAQREDVGILRQLDTAYEKIQGARRAPPAPPAEPTRGELNTRVAAARTTTVTGRPRLLQPRNGNSDHTCSYLHARAAFGVRGRRFAGFRRPALDYTPLRVALDSPESVSAREETKRVYPPDQGQRLSPLRALQGVKEGCLWQQLPRLVQLKVVIIKVFLVVREIGE